MSFFGSDMMSDVLTIDYSSDYWRREICSLFSMKSHSIHCGDWSTWPVIPQSNAAIRLWPCGRWWYSLTVFIWLQENTIRCDTPMLWRRISLFWYIIPFPLMHYSVGLTVILQNTMTTYSPRSRHRTYAVLMTFLRGDSSIRILHSDGDCSVECCCLLR